MIIDTFCHTGEVEDDNDNDHDDDDDDESVVSQLSQCVVNWTHTSEAGAVVVRGGHVDAVTWFACSVERRSKQPSATHRGE